MSITRPFAKPGSGSDNELSSEEFFSQFYIYLDLLDLFIQLFLIKEMIKKKGNVGSETLLANVFPDANKLFFL